MQFGCDNCGQLPTIGLDEFLCRSCAPLEKRLRYDVREALAEIDAAYWRFCRCAQASPPTVAVPGAYQTIRESRRQLFEMGVRDFSDGQQYSDL